MKSEIRSYSQATRPVSILLYSGHYDFQDYYKCSDVSLRMPTKYSDGYPAHKYRVNTVTSSLNFRSTYVSLEHAVAQLVQALRYKPEDRGVDSHWNFSLT
jgi:hypothetical protein